MSKSDLPIKRIDCQKAYRPHTEPTFLAHKSINAFDTETKDGTVFMLSYAIEEFSGAMGNYDTSALSNKKIFNKITHSSCRNGNAINVWYNLDFDANAILSGILQPEQIADLIVQNHTTTEVDGVEYKIDYVKGKFLFIEDTHGNKYEHFDISQFFYMPLDDAAEQWLGKNKLDDVDTTKFGKDTCKSHDEPIYECEDCHTIQEAEQYIQENYDEIKEYAERDAKLTQKLAKELTSEAESMKIPMGKPFSTGYIAEEYKRENMPEKPNFGSMKYQRMFWDSYAGGRFEVFERGDIGEIVAPDINSAYPAVMSQLPDPSSLVWRFYANETDDYSWEKSDTTFNFEMIEEADYGVVRARVTTDSSERIQPFSYKHNGKVHFPALEQTEVAVIKPIFEFGVNSGIVTDYELIDGWFGYENEKTEFPYSYIEDMYADRKVYEIIDERPKQGMLLKIVLNSMYGKTCQTIEDIRIHTIEQGDDYTLEENEKLLPKQYLSKDRQKYLDENQFIIASYRSGRHFNPFIASYITGLTRLKLHKSVYEHGLVDDTVMFATDCIMVRKDAYERSNFEDLIDVPSVDANNFRKKAKESLGKWDFDYQGKGYIVGSGVYEVDKGQISKCPIEDCENYKEKCENVSHRTKTKTRGFIESNLDSTLRELSRNHPDGIPVSNARPVTISEMFTKKDKNVAEFINPTKQIKADFDEKRSWDRENVNFHDLLETYEASEPIKVEGGKVMRETDIDELRASRLSEQPELEFNPLSDFEVV